MSDSENTSPVAVDIELTTSPYAGSQASTAAAPAPLPHQVLPQEARSELMNANDDTVPDEGGSDLPKPRIRKFEHGGKVLSVCYSPDSKSVATGSSDKLLRVIDVGSGK